MKQKFLCKTWGGLFAAIVALSMLNACRTPAPPNSLATHDSRRWEKEIHAFELSDETNPPPANCIVFVGSSSIRKWKTLAEDFPGLPVINRGFGGSAIADSVNFADRIIIPYHPREVVIYAGSNDLHGGEPPDLVYGDFVALVSKIRSALPHAKIAFISIAPTRNRWHEVEKQREANNMIERYCQRHGLMFIDVSPVMLGPDGKPKPDIFVADGLHLNAKGYRLWTGVIRPYVH